MRAVAPVLATITVLVSAAWVPAGDRAARPDSQPVDYVIVVTGGELLSGAYPDGHTHFLTRTLYPLGLHCAGSMSVDDRKPDIEKALRFATKKASLVIVTGGLGPTDNDVTRETLSHFTGLALEEHPEVLQAMLRRFGVSEDRLRANLRRQTQVPTRGTYLKNSNGTAVGLVFEAPETVIVALPGPPRELQGMVRAELVPYLVRRFGTRPPGCSLMLRFVGLGQSQIDQTLKEHVPLARDVTLSSQFDGGRVDFTFSLPDDTPQDRKRLEELKEKIIEHLGDSVYADDETSLEQHVVGLLSSRETTLVVGEVGSGGSLAAGFAGTDDTGRVLAGAYVAPTEAALRRLLRVPDDRWTGSTPGAERVKLLASAASEATGSGCAIVVGQIRRDAKGAHLVDVALKLPGDHLEVRHVRLGGNGQSARFRLTTELLDQLRRKLR